VFVVPVLTLGVWKIRQHSAAGLQLEGDT
jgi:hypothetical protein